MTQELMAWRSTFTATVPIEPATPAVVDPIAVVPQECKDINFVFPYVLSIRNRCHVVATGYPDNPRDWRTKCGWPFGVSHVARPALSLPECHKMLCEISLKAEKEAAKERAESKVREIGGCSFEGVPP